MFSLSSIQVAYRIDLSLVTHLKKKKQEKAMSRNFSYAAGWTEWIFNNLI